MAGTNDIPNFPNINSTAHRRALVSTKVIVSGRSVHLHGLIRLRRISLLSNRHSIGTDRLTHYRVLDLFHLLAQYPT